MFECYAVERKSKKSGNTFVCLEIVFPDGYKKLVFLDRAETFLVSPYVTANEQERSM